MIGLAFALLVLAPAIVVILVIGPVFLLSYRFPYASLGAAILIFAGLIYDHLHNFDGISYSDISPWGLLGLPQSYLPFSLLVALGGIVLAIRSILRRL